MRDTMLLRLQSIMDDEVFLMKFSNNSIESMQNLLYIDFIMYSEKLLNALKKEAESRMEKPQSSEIIGSSPMPIGNLE